MRRGYLNPDYTWRASVVADPLFARKNTKDNTPAIINVQIVPGDKLDVTVAAKGGGSENKSKVIMMNPSDNLVDWVLKPCLKWARVGVRRACWALVWAAQPKKPCCWPKKA